MNSAQYAKLLRRREFEAYANVISVFRAHGELTDLKKRVLNDLKQSLKISQERHVAEVKRALNDDQLATMALEVHNAKVVGDQWLAEIRMAHVVELLDTKLSRDPKNIAYCKLKQRLTDCNVQMQSHPATCTESANQNQTTDRNGESLVLPDARANKVCVMCDVQTQTDFEKHLESQVAAVITQIVDGRRSLAAPSADDSFVSNDPFSFINADTDNRKKAFRKSKLHTRKLAKPLMDVSKRRTKLMQGVGAMRKREGDTQETATKHQKRVSDQRKRATQHEEPVKRVRRASRISNGESEPRRRVVQSHSNRETAAVSSAGVAQPTRLQVLDSSHWQPAHSPLSSSLPEPGVCVTVSNTYEGDSGEAARFEVVLESTKDANERITEEVRRSRSESETGSLNLKLNDTTFIQQTLLAADKHELVQTKSGGAHVLVSRSANRLTASALSLSVPVPSNNTQHEPKQNTARRTQKVPVATKKRQMTQRTINEPAGARPVKRVKRDVANDAEPFSRKPRKKKISSDEVGTQSTSEKGAAFKVKLPALHKTKSGANGATTGRNEPAGIRDSMNSAAFTPSSSANTSYSDDHNDAGTHLSSMQLLPAFACATGTSYNYSSLAHTRQPHADSHTSAAAIHSVPIPPSNSSPPSRPHTFGSFPRATTPLRPSGPSSTSKSTTVASSTPTQQSMYEFVDEAGSSSASSMYWSGTAAQPVATAQAVALVPTGLPTHSISSSLSSGANVTQARGAPTLRGRGAIALHGRSAVFSGAAIRPSAVNRIVCVDRSQAPPSMGMTPPIATRPPATGLAAPTSDQRSVLLARRGAISATPRVGAQPLSRTAVMPNAVSVIMQKGAATSVGVRTPIVMRKIPSQSIVSVIKPTLPNSQAK